MLLVGLVRRPHGLAGELSVEPVTDFPGRFAPGVSLDWRRGDHARRLTVRGARVHGARLLLSFDGVDGIDAARLLAGGELSVPEEEAAPARPGFYYAHQLRGFRCEDREGRFAGTVVNLERTAAGPLLAIETVSGKEALVPFVEPIVVSVDDASRKIVIDPPEGLLDV